MLIKEIEQNANLKVVAIKLYYLIISTPRLLKTQTPA